MMPKLSFLSGRAFDTGLAGLAAVSAGFVVFAMPDSLFTGLVETSRIPDFIPAAQPPLGETARLAALGSAALLTFSSVWALMAGLGRVPARRKSEAKAEPKGEAEAPRLRRADAHPDAPARRPLLARDLGEPLDLDDYAETPAEEARIEDAQFEDAPVAEAEDRPRPGFLIPQAPEPEPVAEARPEWTESEPERPGAEPEWTPPEAGSTPSQPEWTPPEAESTPSQPEWTPPEAESTPSQPEWSAAEPQSGEAEQEWEEAKPEPQPELRRPTIAPILPISELAAQLPEGEEDPDQSLSQLVNRIEFGLSRKRQALPSADLPPAEEMPAEAEKVGHRLRSAINDLQKIASSGA